MRLCIFWRRTGESTTDLVFSGHRIVAENGDVLEDSGLFSLGLTTTEIDVLRLDSERRRMRSISHAESDISAYQKIMFSMPLSETELTRRFERNPFVSDDAHELRRRCRTILSIQAHGLRKRLEHTGARFVIIGVSGGLDSTLALIACAETMDLMGRPRSDIMAITMPGFGTTNRTRKNAEYLAEQVGAMFRTIPINDAVTQHFNDISPTHPTMMSYMKTHRRGSAHKCLWIWQTNMEVLWWDRVTSLDCSRFTI